MELLRSKRIARFVEEYVIDKNGSAAATRAGFAHSSAHDVAVKLLNDPLVQEMVRLEEISVARDAHVDAVWVLRQWMQIATADPTLISFVRRVNCRYCHGINHAYQWGEREFAEACDYVLSFKATKDVPRPDMPRCEGGFGWRRNAEPHPDCPECCGEGHEDTFFRDIESLTGPERRLIAGIKRTKDGLEIKYRDQDVALKSLAQYFGMMEAEGEGRRKPMPKLPPEYKMTSKELGDYYAQYCG